MLNCCTDSGAWIALTSGNFISIHRLSGNFQNEIGVDRFDQSLHYYSTGEKSICISYVSLLHVFPPPLCRTHKLELFLEKELRNISEWWHNPDKTDLCSVWCLLLFFFIDLFIFFKFI